MSTKQDIPYGYCHCGCGERTSLAKQTSRRFGHVRGEPVRFLVGHVGAKSIEEKLAEKTGAPDENGCWPWVGWFGKDSPYGIMTHRGKARTAHRWAWIAANGEIPDDWQVHHECENPACVNPDHLEAVDTSTHAKRHLSDRCGNGHEWTPENTHLNKAGTRVCRACRRNAQQALRDAKEKPRRVCGTCGESFTASPHFRRYCSKECRDAAYYYYGPAG